MEATAMSGRIDTPIAAGIVVVAAVLILVGLHRVVLKIK